MIKIKNLQPIALLAAAINSFNPVNRVRVIRSIGKYGSLGMYADEVDFGMDFVSFAGNDGELLYIHNEEIRSVQITMFGVNVSLTDDSIIRLCEHMQE